MIQSRAYDRRTQEAVYDAAKNAPDPLTAPEVQADQRIGKIREKIGQLEDKRTPRLQARSAAKTMAAATTASTTTAPMRPDNDQRRFYVVRAGDTLWSIATRFSTTVERLKRLNNLTGRGARELQVGQRLAVKDRES